MDNADTPLSDFGWEVRSMVIRVQLSGELEPVYCECLRQVGQVGKDGRSIIIGICVAAVAAAGCVIIMRRRSNPGFSFAPVSSGTLRILLMAVGLVSLVSLLTFLTIMLEYFYDLKPIQASLAMIPAQLGAVFGAKVLATMAIKRWGGIRAIRVLVLGIAIPILGLVIFQTSTPTW